MKRAAGFTLVEVLVAVTLLGLVSLLAYSALNLGMKYWRAVQQESAAQQQQRAVHHYLVRQLEVVTTMPENATTALQPNLRGSLDRLSFVAPLAAASARGGLYQIELRRDSDAANPARQRLTLRYRPLQQSPQGALDDDELVLLSDIEGLEWAYFGSQIDGGAARWQGSWQHPKRLPQQVRLRYRDAAERELRMVLRTVGADGNG